MRREPFKADRLLRSVSSSFQGRRSGSGAPAEGKGGDARAVSLAPSYLSVALGVAPPVSFHSFGCLLGIVCAQQ